MPAKGTHFSGDYFQDGAKSRKAVDKKGGKWYSWHGCFLEVKRSAMARRNKETGKDKEIRKMKYEEKIAPLEEEMLKSLERLVKYIRVTEKALGDGVKKVYDSERPSWNKLRRVK